MKTSFEGLMNRWDTTEERIRKLEDMSVKLSQTEVQREKIMKKIAAIADIHGNYIALDKCVE